MTDYAVDHTESLRIAERMKKSVHRLHELAPLVGHSRQIREFTNDRKKNLLAKYIVPALKAGESAVAAEAIARANPAYQQELEAIAKGHEEAERVIAENNAESCAFEASRSLLSFSKATLEHVE